MRSLSAVAAVFMVTLLSPFALFAAEKPVTFRGQTIYVDGDPQQIWIGDKTSSDAELVLLYTNYNAAVNSLRTEQKIEARVLVVGGGGAGGYGTTTTINPGGGGGGGQAIELENSVYDPGTLSMTIGAGGKQTIAAGNGENGHPTSFVKPGETIIALGGGGGGSKANGNGDETVATGGGGSGSGKLGGVGALGNDYKGGNAGGTNRGGGGGGAGGPGGNGAANAQAGNGGAGVKSDITNAVAGVTTGYGGGGGGAQASNTSDATVGAGVDGGGRGGRQARHGEPGVPGTGGGGGGGGRASNGYYGGAGGSGVVIIRITKIYVELKWKPIPVSAGGNDGKIFVDENAVVSTDAPTGDLIITYTNTTVDGGLRFFDPKNPTLPPVWARARVLVVGGGGGGGFINDRQGGAGAGGGAGGFVEKSGLVFDNTVEYSVSVGAGGKGGSTNKEAGENGKDSSLKADGTAVVDVALGGGGGGAQSDGLAGASGGGGSCTLSGDLQGGAALQGFKGGDTQDVGLYAGAGGGGAGSAGENAKRLVPGAGGDGLSCDITGSLLWYAAGGGGAFINASNLSSPAAGAKGGSGIGGNGAGVENSVAVAATSGKDGTGSGGGGGTSHVGGTSPAGKGGDGIVIIRLSGFVVKGVPMPEANNVTYDGAEHCGVKDSTFSYAYELSGDVVRSNADCYVVTATLKYPGMIWQDGGQLPINLTWRINQMRVPQPAAVPSLVYNGEVQYPVDKAKLHLDDDGYCFTDEGHKYCFLTATHKATDVAAYHFTAKLVTVDPQGNFATNFVWSNTSSMADRDYDWDITKAPNKIIWTSPYRGYLLSRLDTPAKAHYPTKHVKSDWGLGDATVEYRPIESGAGTAPPPGEGQGSEEGWKAWPPAEKGNYTLRITIKETLNWEGDSVTTDFGTWDNLADLFSDRMDVTVSGKSDSSTELADFPLPVRVREPEKDGYSVFSGFSYARAGATGKEIRFFDANGDPVEHEVDTWNTHGESLLWVRAPTLKANNVKVLTMCWRRVSDIRLPAYNPADVWANYAGVWHFSQKEDGFWPDSSGNELNAQLTAGGKATTIDGKFGRALYVDTGDVIVDGYNGLGNTTNFMFSGWYRGDEYTKEGQGQYNFIGTKMGQKWNVSPGWSFIMNQNVQNVGATAAGNYMGDVTISTMKTAFQYLAYVVPNNSTTRYSYYNGANQRSTTGDISINAQPLQLAGAKFSCDEVRLRKTAPANYATWAKEEYNSLKNASYCTYGLVRIDCDRSNDGNGLICDWWTAVPSIAKTVWHKGETLPMVTSGMFKDAKSAVTYVCVDQANGTAVTNKLPTEIGFYKATFDHTPPATGYRSQPHTIDFYIIEATVPIYDIGGHLGDSGRILLMNADNHVRAPVTNQGWCAQSDAGVTYWRRLSGSGGETLPPQGEGTNNVMPGTSFELVRSADANVLWRLYDCRQGNTFPTNDNQMLSSSLCYLPASSSTALSITNEDVKAGRADTGWVLMRNIAGEPYNDAGACVYSPCYSNGIGTIYFDAVNSRKSVAANIEGYKLILEIATQTQAGLPPFDTNCWYEVNGVTNWYGNLEGMWKPVEMSAMRVNGTAYTDQPATNCLALKMATGGRTDHFYRVHARADVHKPCRFRIRRVSIDEAATDAGNNVDPDAGYILLDNIIASFPPVVAELTPYGEFDPALGGVRAVGFGGAFESPFPSFAEGASLTGRCAVAFTGDYKPDEESSFSLKQMVYRWRYLDQPGASSAADGDWKAANLQEAGGELRTTLPLEAPAEPGDIEFYFVTILRTPYYGYVDYTGLDKPISEKGYTEEGLPHESRYAPRSDDETLATGGRDWFIRLRDGRSNYEGVRLITRPAGGGAVETNAFELVGDDQWTVKLRTRNPIAAGLEFRIEGLNPQTPGAKEYAFSTDCWKADNRIEKFPLRESVTSCTASEWGWVACDAATGWLYFQFDLADKMLQVAHAEAEDFSRWSSALNADGLFVGSAVDTNASSAVTREALVDWGKWSASIATSESWQESFGVDGGVVTVDRYPRNEPFSTARSVHGWTAESAMWTYGKWSKQNNSDPRLSMGDDSAVQLMGLGQGRLSFIDAEKVPNGLDTVIYRARVGQVNDFNDFAHYEWYLGTSFEDMVPTRLMSNYTVATIAALTETGADSYDGDGSVSLIGYYNDEYGCYEFRVSRGTNDKDLRLALFRWRKVGAGYVCDKLLDENTDASKRKNYFDYSNKDATTGAGCCAERLVKNSKTLYGGLFLSVMEDGGKTLVTAGVCETDVSTLNGSESMSGQNFTCITYHDADKEKRLTKGTFGLSSCNCPGLFAKPVCYRAGVQSYKPSKSGFLQSAAGQNITFSGDKITGSGDESYYTRWTKFGRLERASGHDWWGFQAATPEPQKVLVQISDHGASNWEDATNVFVKGFTSQTFRNVIHDPRPCDVRLQVGGATSSARTDVIIDEVSLTQWNGQWTEHWDDGTRPWNYLTNEFVYTSAWVAERSGRRSLRLQPSRAKDKETPVSLRSPMMRGLGLIHFSWRDADPRATIRVQYKKQVTDANIVNATKSLASGKTETGYGWVDVKTIPVGAIGTSGSWSEYINERYAGKVGGRDYYFGLIRLVIDRDVQEAAISRDRRRTDPDYGAVTITDAFVWDFPEYDKSGWIGWNFRAAGWNGTTPDVFANLKDSFRGLSGLLNNTLDEATLADREKGHYSQRLPSVQSPSFRTNCVGALSFRARLYDADDLLRAGHAAVVTVYGCSAIDDKGDPVGEWKVIGDVEISNRTYAVQTVKIPATLDCKAIRLAVNGVKGVTDVTTEVKPPKYDPPIRVAIDDICIWERLSQSLAFRKSYVRPFRDATAIKGTEVVQDIDTMAEQPLIGESFGFQAEVEVLDPDEVITDDPDYPITVDLWYYAPEAGKPMVWGFENWKTNAGVVKVMGLKPATGRGDRLVFRSTVEQSASLCPPQFLEKGEGYRIVQYHLTARYYVQGHSEGVHELQSSEWAMPSWNAGFTDPNLTNAAFSAFTLLEEIAPGRAWINEINFCEPTKDASLANQWIELAVPSGVDMTDWTVDVFDYTGERITTLARLGRKLMPASKTYRGTNPTALASHYAFYTIKSPDTTAIAADATWARFNKTGALEYNRPYAFTLTRPTGVIEHRVVAQGYNDVKGLKFFWPDYEGTNLVKVMHARYGGDWTWSAEDLHTAGAENCSVSVITNQGFAHADWTSPLKMTPGDINGGQYISPDWYILPNGGYVKIYSSVLGDHMRQIIGGVTNQTGDITISQGNSTSIVYVVDRWYKLGSYEVKPDERAAWTGPSAADKDGRRKWTLNLSQVSNRIDITVAADISDDVKSMLDPKYDAYRPAIMKWLETGVTGGADGGEHKFKNPNGPLKPMHYRGVDGTACDELKLPDLYWLDVDPTDGDWELWGGMGDRPGSPGTLGQVDVAMNRVKILADGSTFIHTNHLTTVWLELRNTNEAHAVSYPPYRLQGLGNEQSDHYTGSWTSANFKVTMRLANGKVDEIFQPMRYFVFGWNSFRAKDDPVAPYAARIEITDPFSDQSPASEWGWQKYSDCGVFTGWALDGRVTPGGVSTLKKNDLLEF